MSLTTPPITDEMRRKAAADLFYKRRKSEYNTWLSTLTPYQIGRLCHAVCPVDHSRSMEEYLHEQYVSGIIKFTRLSVELAMILA